MKKRLRIEKYLASRAAKGPWKITGDQNQGYAGVVVIPSLAESNLLFSTLKSIAGNPEDILLRFLILVVVNNRENGSLSEKEDNRATLRRLEAGGREFLPVRVAWVDAASPGLGLPVKRGGVGIARKIGFDLALNRLDFDRGCPLLVSLDADTIVRPDYLPAIVAHFRASPIPGAVIPFCHQPGATPEEDRAIRRYELFLRAYVLGLERAGSPYAFHTVGSAMACTAEGYARMGGMNQRGAGEDFYFLQQLAKTGGVSQVRGTLVYPSARISHRVPFGTGRSMTDLLSGKEGAVSFYRAECFQILADWLALVGRSLDWEGEKIQEKILNISIHLYDFIKKYKFQYIWEKLRRNFRSCQNLLKGFHDWFDGLKTLKLIHHLSDGPYPRQEPERVMPDLLRWAGLEPLEGVQSQLELLRKVQNPERVNSLPISPGLLDFPFPAPSSD
ncbi:MAG: hypothetical protein HXY45_11220 [Syntrophaceae bacterium]|nr:hypothetical protein [Syntrophaceae bacterium]